MPIADIEIETATTPGAVCACVLHALSAGRVMVTLPTKRIEHIIAEAGNALPPQYGKELPLHLSICAHVAEMNHPLLIDDAFVHPLLARHPAVPELGIAAYAGVPIMPVQDRAYQMVLCAQQIKPREWSRDDLALLKAGAARIRALSPEIPAL